ncbi:hypothetical protein JZO78_09500 [Enterococcus ureilyticus]|uniref:hypothetical protein n=1 Tax=Enterococcus ureilyticus TaxID=1131292 RepID=UPI001A934328|nr:hypothetical protein [Enterococcus ureilyticus]MBO0446580.1 hypothetical protein [Enterococcus ureilyticus]
MEHYIKVKYCKNDEQYIIQYKMLRICIDIIENEPEKDSRSYREALTYAIAMVKKYLR